MRRVALGLIVTCAYAYGSPWAVTAEGGAEVDTNVQRVETGPGVETGSGSTAPVTAPVLRLGGHVEHHDAAFGGAYALGLSDLTRYVLSDDDGLSNENVTQLAGDARWLHPVGTRPVSIGIGATAIDAIGLTDPVGARTFRSLGADGLIALRSGDDHRLMLGVGVRSFHYKPDPQYDYMAPSLTARLDSVLWETPDKTRSLELATTLEFEDRVYGSSAFADGCAPGSKPDPACFAATELTRRDRYARVGAEVTYVGHNILAIGYQLTGIGSNSFGESLARHRVIASGTTSWGHVYATLLAILQIDQYLDGLPVQSAPQHNDYTNIEDENRSSLQLRVAYKWSTAWAFETRAAIWKNIGDSTAELSFDRQLIYAGLVYSR
jgi:hypothetical protein